MLKETRSAMALTLLAALAIFVPRTVAQQSSTKPTSAVSAKKFVPFTLERRMYDFDSSGTRGFEWRHIVARRSDGATVTSRFQPQDKETATHPRMRVIQFLDGHSLEIYDNIRAFVDWPAPRERTLLQSELLAPSKNCFLTGYGLYFDKYDTLGGVRVAVIRSLPKGSSGITRWLAPELGCEELQNTYTQVQADGSFRLVSEEKFVSLRLGEPDAAFFNVPSTYASLTPSAALHKQTVVTGGPWNSEMQAEAARMDAAYDHRLKESRANAH